MHAKIQPSVWRIFGGIFDLGEKEKLLKQREEEMADPNFWGDHARAQKIIQEVKELKDLVEQFQHLNEKVEEVSMMIELLEEEEEPELYQEQVETLKQLEKEINQFEIRLMLNGPYDRNSAYIELHPGAGGTESQDWAEMLFRMYSRWAEKNGYKVEVLDYLKGEEAGLKSATLLIKGPYAYGYLKAEKGVHRLVRISPFDSSGRRHTSFASLHVMPELDDDVEVEIRSEDLIIDTYKSSGAGGQHVNTTDSAVRITHRPTGIVVTCQSERSQIKNRERAMKVLKARLYQHMLEEQQKKLEAIKGEQTEIGWGNQIRSYVFHPYSMVKDLRTKKQISNVNAVMDGEIQPFIEAYLQLQLQEQREAKST